MGKSSSLKKKRSRNSSQLRTRKRSKVKSRRSKSKKSKKLRHRHDDSVSYSGDSDSRSMASVSSSSSEDDYRSRRSSSRTWKGVKGGKKRVRRLSSSGGSSEDSPYVKKHRGSRRDDKRKRTGKKKKKSMRDVSVSSRSSGSWSCSTCRSDSDAIGYEKRRARTKMKGKDGRRLEKVKRGSKNNKDRSRSSSCNRYNEGSDHPIEERVMEENNSRRLKSVITVVRHKNESSRELNSDDPKEEVYDYDHCSSCRSIDSNDGSRRELPRHSHVVSETKRPLDDEQGEVSNIRTSSVQESGQDGKCWYDGVGNNDALREENKVASAPTGLNVDDMESILRQRALENLRKFRGGLQKNINPSITQNDKSNDVKTPSSVKTNPTQIKAPKGDDPKVVIASKVSQQIRQPPVRRDSTTLRKKDRNASHLNDDGKDSGPVESDAASPPAQVVLAGVPRVEVNTAIKSVSNNKSKLVMSQTRSEACNTRTTQKQEAAAQEPSLAKLITESSVNDGGLETNRTVKPPKDNAASVSIRPKSVLPIRQELSNTYTSQKQESAALESSQANLVTESSVIEVSLGTAQTVKPPECSNSGSKVNDTCNSACNKLSSSSISTPGQISSDKREAETIDGSQFQQKTMSVMQGGEMVQVSYQVYIPKRAPALARRQLKR